MQANIRVAGEGFGMPQVTVKPRALRSAQLLQIPPKGAETAQPKRAGRLQHQPLPGDSHSKSWLCWGTTLTFLLPIPGCRRRSQGLCRPGVTPGQGVQCLLCISKRSSGHGTAPWMYFRSFFLNQISYNNFAATPNHKHLSQNSRVPLKK